MINEDEIRPDQAERLKLWQGKEQQRRRDQEAAHRQFTAGYGEFVAGDYELEQTITYRSRGGGLHRGRVIWSYGPSKTPVTGRQRPLLYVVTGDQLGGLPIEVEPGQIVEK